MRHWLSLGNGVKFGGWVLAALWLAAPVLAQESGGVSRHLVPADVLATVIYGLIGMVLAIGGYFLFDLVTPFSIKHELVEDHNVAMGIVVGALFLGVSIIVAAAIL